MDPTTSDHRRFCYALAARDIRRITAQMHRADVDGEMLETMIAALEQLEMRIWILAFEDPDSGSGLLDQQDTYSDGHPVTSNINWGSGYSTVIHSCEPGHPAVDHSGELADERWPDSSEAY